MAKSKRRFVCQECGHQAPKWMGRCDGCGAWNTMAEEEIAPASDGERRAKRKSGPGPQRLSEVDLKPEHRLISGIGEFDRVLGGGIMTGSLSLLAGAPGIGKSTLLTELGKYLSDRRLLYVTGEESPRQVKLRANRLNVDNETFYLLAETNVQEVIDAIDDVRPEIVVIDSIQTIHHPDYSSAPGSVTQVRESASTLQQTTKARNLATIIVGHVTKEGAIAGPRVLEHMVDTVLYFEGDQHYRYRVLRAVKNRFGATPEIGLFEMREGGLKEVLNPSEVFLSERDYGESGAVVVCAMEGTRPLLVEIQALVAQSSYGTPQRTASGFDNHRLRTLLAVLEKREGFGLSSQDVFLNIAGGVRLDEPAVDLGVAMAIASSYEDIPAATDAVLIGEVGLSGEVRAVTRLSERLGEVEKLGFGQAVVPASSKDEVGAPGELRVRGVKNLRETLEIVL